MPGIKQVFQSTARPLGVHLKRRLKQLAGWCIRTTLVLLALFVLFHIEEDIRGHLAWSRMEKELRACALELHFLEHGGYPDSLNSLIPDHFDKMPLDLVDREPLRYLRIDDDSYKLYSVGPDWRTTVGGFVRGGGTRAAGTGYGRSGCRTRRMIDT